MAGTFSLGRYRVAYSEESDVVFAQIFEEIREAGVPLTVEQQRFRDLIAPVNVILPSLILIDGLFVTPRSSGSWPPPPPGRPPS